jgi:Radical SAM superfamily
MRVSSLKIGRLASGGIITNYFCTSACRHCLYNCGPHWEKNYISVEVAEKNFRAVKSLGCSAVHIGGGEPMLRPEELGAVLDAAVREGVSIDYVETNSSWYKEPESAETLLAGLRPNGLHTLLVSISPFHNEHIPFFKTQGVMDACRKVGVRIFPWTAEFIPDLSGLDGSRPHALSEFEERYGKDFLRGILGRYWVHMGGRALDTFRPVLRTKTLEHILRENPTDCSRELTDTSHFHLDLFGNYIPGLCAGLAIARDDLGKPLAEDKYPLLNILNAKGIRGLLDFAAREYAFKPRQIGYINKCDLCTEIRFFLVQEGYDSSEELCPGEFYSGRI